MTFHLQSLLIAFPGLFFGCIVCQRLQVLANANTRIQGTVSAAAEAADTSSAAFDVPQAMSDISKVAAVQQDAFTNQVANLAAAVAASPEVDNSTVTEIETLRSVSHTRPTTRRPGLSTASYCFRSYCPRLLGYAQSVTLLFLSLAGMPQAG